VKRQEVIETKIQFLKTDLGLVDTLLQLAATRKAIGNRDAAKRTLIQIHKALTAISVLLADRRIPVPAADASKIRAHLKRCRTRLSNL
jgi:hypothetical protein